MREPIVIPTNLKNRILASIYIFRSLPTYYFSDVQTLDEAKKKVQYLINNLLQSGLVKKKQSQRKTIQFLLLTKRGHDFVTKHIFENSNSPFYLYRTDRLAKFTDSDHRFMNFAYIWKWLQDHATELKGGVCIYEDSNRNYCKINFTYGSDSIVLYPDVLILLPDIQKGSEFYKALIVENDTGTETSGMLFNKIVEYAAYGIRGLQQGFITQATLIFNLHSKVRSNRLLPNTINHAQNYNSTRKVKDVSAAHILEAFGERGIQLNFAIVDTINHEYIPLVYDLRKELLVKNPSWQYLI